MEQKIIARLEAALGVAKMALEQGQFLSSRIAANGPTIEEVIDSALMFSKNNSSYVLSTALGDIPIKQSSEQRYYSEGYLLWEMSGGQYELAGIINSEGHEINRLSGLGTDEEEAIEFVKNGETSFPVIDLVWKIKKAKND